MKTSPFYQWGRQFVANLPLESSHRILDFGCRNGSVSAYVANQQHLQVMAIDKYDHHIETAQCYRQNNLEFETLDIIQLAEANHYDAIISFNALLWVQNKLLALQNIYRALKPGKRAHLLFFAAHGRPKNDRFFYQTACQTQWKSYFHKFIPDYYETTLSEFGGLLQALGFLIHRMEIKRYDTMFAHQEDLLNFLDTWGAHHKHLPTKKSRLFLDDTTKNYLNEHHINPMDPVAYHEYFLEVDCEKPYVPLPQKHSSYEFGNITLTRQEARILKYYLQGKSAKEIARHTEITAKTVEFHIAKIKEKLNCSFRSDVFQTCGDLGILQLIYDPLL